MDNSTQATAPDRGYRDSVAKVEPYGVDHIPDVERHGKPISQFYVWFAAGLNFPIMILGFSAAWFGLSLFGAVTAVIAGAAVGSVLMAVLSRMGVHLGVPQQMQARGPLGFVGNLLPVAYINVFAGIGWAALTVILGGKALGELTGLPFTISALGLVALQLVVAIFGYNMIHFLQKVLSFVLVGLFLLLTIVAVTRGSTTLGANPDAGGYIGSVGGWLTLFGWFLAFLVAWTPFASDYSRYLPDDPDVSRKAGLLTGLGNFITLSWLGIAGAIVAGGATTLDPIDAVRELTGPWAAPCLLAILLSSFSQNFLNVYGGAISLRDLRTARQPHPGRRTHLCRRLRRQPLGPGRCLRQVHRLPQPHGLLHRAVRRGDPARLRVRRPQGQDADPRALRQEPRARVGLRGLARRRRRLGSVLAVHRLHRPSVGQRRRR